MKEACVRGRSQFLANRTCCVLLTILFLLSSSCLAFSTPSLYESDKVIERGARKSANTSHEHRRVKKSTLLARIRARRVKEPSIAQDYVLSMEEYEDRFAFRHRARHFSTTFLLLCPCGNCCRYARNSRSPVRVMLG